jgi:hypothetical protein
MWARNRWEIDESIEREAYRVQSYVSEAGHSDDTSGVWNNSWASSADREALRQDAVKTPAHASMEASRKAFEANGGNNQ